VGEENFAWVVETAANYAIEKAQSYQEDKDNLTWGEYVKTGAAKEHLLSSEKPSIRLHLLYHHPYVCE